ncbi:hypothetical protein J6590_088190 [Homalodisca vitripennis]|nr:hypothetical protein J6590_088190 [Homalodisca vitripennis]
MKWSVGLLLPSKCPGDFPDAADTTVSLMFHKVIPRSRSVFSQETRPKAKPLSVSNLIPFDSAGMTSKLLSLRVPVTGALKPGARLLQITSSQPQPVTSGTWFSVLIAEINDLAAGD